MGWQWQPFSSTVYVNRLRKAFGIINAKLSSYASCDAAFRALPGGRSFAQVWADPSVWISYDPGKAAGRFGATMGNEVAISDYTCRMGEWTMVATLIHELAHVNGAGAGHDAEGTLEKCLMKAHHDPHIMGQVIRQPRNSLLAQISSTRAAALKSGVL